MLGHFGDTWVMVYQCGQCHLQHAITIIDCQKYIIILRLSVAAIIILIRSIPLLLCVICFHDVLLKGVRGIFNVRNDLGVSCAHQGETGTEESTQMLTQEN